MSRTRVVAVAAGLFLLIRGVSWAQFIGTNVSECGTINAPGEYLIGPPLDPENPIVDVTHKGGGDCLRIEASNVTVWFFNGDPTNLVGDGRGTAIHILRSAHDTHIFTFVGGGVMNFAVGIEDDADSATIKGGFDEPMSMLTTRTGVLLNNVNGTFIANLQIGCRQRAEGSGCAAQIVPNPAPVIGPKTGIFVKGGSGNIIHETSFPTGQGCLSGFGGVICTIGTGISVAASSENQISADIYAGTTGIEVSRSSDFNIISLGHMSSLDTGISIQRRSSNNTIDSNVVLNSAIVDLIDHNPNCGTDIWTNNTFTSADPVSCIH